MVILLLIITFSGSIERSYYTDRQQCETALFERTDLGQYKTIKIARCIKLRLK
jgi:hypothetical protein